MKPHRLLLTAVAVTALALTGCSDLNQTVPAADVTAVKSATPSPTPTPTPTVWAKDAAAAAYLQAVCPVNKLVTPFNNALQNGNFDQLHTLAPQMMQADRDAAQKLDQGKWSAEIAPDVAVVRDAYFATIAVDQSVAAATTMDQLNAVVWPDTTAAATASQRLRSRLGLAADQMAGC